MLVVRGATRSASTPPNNVRISPWGYCVLSRNIDFHTSNSPGVTSVHGDDRDERPLLAAFVDECAFLVKSEG